ADLFSWTGEKADMDKVDAAFREGARHMNRAPELFADEILAEAISLARAGALRTTVTVGSQAEKFLAMAIMFIVLSLDSGHPRAPGTIRDYLPAFDFCCDLHHAGDGRFKYLVSSPGRSFDA